jgi:hypothetical protein
MTRISPPKVKPNDKFNRWVVLDVERVGGYYYAECQCNCGNIKKVRQDSLLNGESSSCGCLAKEKARERLTTHGGSGHRLFQRWFDMNRRCYSKKRKDYKHYGGRGIQVCDEWHYENPNGFENFVNDMEESYVEGLELDRIDNDGNYEPSNCKWSTRSEQIINSRSANWLTYDGETLHLSAMAKKYGLTSKKLVDRIGKLGWSLEKALTEPHRVKSYTLNIDGVDYKPEDVFVTNIGNAAKKYKVDSVTMFYNLFADGEITVYKNVQGERILCEDKVFVDLLGFKVKLKIASLIPKLYYGVVAEVVDAKR